MAKQRASEEEGKEGHIGKKKKPPNINQGQRELREVFFKFPWREAVANVGRENKYIRGSKRHPNTKTHTHNITLSLTTTRTFHLKNLCSSTPLHEVALARLASTSLYTNTIILIWFDSLQPHFTAWENVHNSNKKTQMATPPTTSTHPKDPSFPSPSSPETTHCRRRCPEGPQWEQVGDFVWSRETGRSRCSGSGVGPPWWGWREEGESWERRGW